MAPPTPAQLAAQVPELRALPVRPLGSGLDHTAFALGDAWVLRVASHAEDADTLPREARLLRWLAPRLPLPVPVPRWVGEMNGLSYSVAPRLGGESGLMRLDSDPVSLGPVLGDFLCALHGLEVPPDIGLPVDHDPSGADWQEAALADLDVARRAGALEAGPDWAAVLHAPPPLDLARPVPIHGDFAAEHVMLDGETITGIIDWADAALGDPARDWAGLLHWAGRPLLDASGMTNSATVRRAAWYALCRALGDVAFGVQAARPAHLDAGRRVLRALARDFGAQWGRAGS